MSQPAAVDAHEGRQCDGREGRSVLERIGGLLVNQTLS
jgi:hypothetical protein